MTSEKDGNAYFQQLVTRSEAKPSSSEDLQKSIMEAIQELNQNKNKGETKKVVKFAGENIEYLFSRRIIE